MTARWSDVAAPDRWKIAAIWLVAGIGFTAAVAPDVGWPAAVAIGLGWTGTMVWMTPRYLIRDPRAETPPPADRPIKPWTLLLGLALVAYNAWRAISGDLDIFVALGLLSGGVIVIAGASRSQTGAGRSCDESG